MQSVKLLSRTGADGILRLEVQTDLHDSDVDVIVVMHPLFASRKDDFSEGVAQVATECDLPSLLERCELDTARLLGPGAANRLANWRQYVGNQVQLVEFIQRVLRGHHRANGWELHQQGGLSLERIVIEHCPGLFTLDDIDQAKATLGI